MSERIWLGFFTALTLACRTALASTAQIEVTDAGGRPLSETVVVLSPESSAAPAPASALPAESIIDQRHETFLPLVTLIREGGHVIFTNNDATMHQVYSFSDIRQFAFEIDEGQRSQPVTFEKPGVAAIGCNIHDQMITYVYVASQPFGAVSDRSGHATIVNVAEGRYRGSAWHPGLAPGTPGRAFELVVTATGGRARVVLPVVVGSARTAKHMQMY
ncbi:MAG TPA: hypothetical protein VGL35_14400 [Rhizomicrobium sp.]|jgi:plastocyanin